MGLFALLALVALATATVTKVTEANADVLKGPALVKFFAPWCGHCKNMAADWVTLSEQAKDFTVAEVDCTEADSKSLCEKHQIRGYPTVLFFKDGNVYKYNRPRKVADFADFASAGYSQAGVEKSAA